MGWLSIKILTTVFKPNLGHIKSVFGRHVHITEPIKYIHFITAACAASTIVFTAAHFSILFCTARTAHGRVFKRLKVKVTVLTWLGQVCTGPILAYLDESIVISK